MTTIIREVYEALKEAGASEEKAAAAAQAIQAVCEEERLCRIEERLTRVGERLTLLQWMIGFNLALSTAVLVKLWFDPRDLWRLSEDLCQPAARDVASLGRAPPS